MAGISKDDASVLSDDPSQPTNELRNARITGLSTGVTSRSATRSTTRSVSMTAPTNITEPYGENSLVSHTGPLYGAKLPLFTPMSGPLYTIRKLENFHQPMNGKLQEKTNGAKDSYIEMGQTDWPGDNSPARNEHLLKSGPLGRCNHPFCTTCPTNYDFNAAKKKYKRASAFENKGTLYGDAKGWAQKSFLSLKGCIPGIMNPHTKVVQQWNQFFVISCLLAIFVDPLFFFLLSVYQEHKCITFNWSLAKAIVVVRSFTDFIYFLHMLLQFRLAYIAPETRVVGAGDLVDHPKKIALHYLHGYFLLDLFVVLPLPQIMILVVVPKYLGSSEANYAKNLLRATVLIQYIPRIFRFLPLLAGQSATGFIFESAWANFVINLLIFVLAGHVVGSSWYLFGVQRVNQCLRDVCSKSKIEGCKRFIDCGHGIDESESNTASRLLWTTSKQANDCFVTDNGPFDYGIYKQVTLISTRQSIVTRYVYSLFWGFQQISTLAGNLVPSDFVWEVLFTMGIVGLGLFLFALLIGNMQNFLQSLGRRRLEMQLRRRDVEQWMRHRRLPDNLRRQVRQAERFSWAATRGVNEEELMSNLPEDLQREIRRHLFKFLKKVRIFTVMEPPVLDAIGERLRQHLYIGGSKILYPGGPIDKIVFIVRGKMESMGGDGNPTPLSEGDVCGEELLTWCLDHPSLNRDVKKFRRSGQRLFSNRTVQCLTNVEAFALRADDLEEVTAIFARVLRNPHVQAAIRYESPYWRTNAAICIQVAWRYRKKRLGRLASCGTQSHNKQYI